MMGAAFARRPGLAVRAACGALLALAAAAAPAADPAGGPGIYTCVDDQGRRLTSDRPIPQCSGKEQRVLNRDGSVRQIVPPTLTAEERAERETAERRAARERAEQADAVRRDRNLLARYPDEAAHQRAREAALDPIRMASRQTEQRLRELAAERKPLLDEAEFYKNRPLPPKLRQALDANEGATEAQRAAAQTQNAEMVRINKLYDQELEHLKKLWAGAPPGSLRPASSSAGFYTAPASATPRKAASAPGKS
jgi:hypothetical protein